MAQKKITITTVASTLVNLEKEYGLLSRDMIHQEDLFQIQEKLCVMLAEISNAMPSVQKRLQKEMSYLFQFTEVTG